MYDVKGKVKVRLGVLEFQDGERFSEKKFNDVEALLITSYQPLENTTNYHWYYGRNNLHIINVGRRGIIDKQVFSNDLEWAY